MIYFSGLMLSVWPANVAVPAQEARKVAIIFSGTANFYEQALEGFRRGLSQRNVSAKTEVFILPKAESELNAFFEGIARAKPDLILSVGSISARITSKAVKTVPVVYCMIFDPESFDIHHGAVSLDIKPAVQVEFILKSFPGVTNIGVVYNPATYQKFVSELREMGSGKARLSFAEATNVNQIDGALAVLRKAGAECLLMLSDPTLYTTQTIPSVILSTLQQKLSIVTSLPAVVKAGALAGIYADAGSNGAGAGEVAARILLGEDVGSIPNQWTAKYRTALNMIVAQRLEIQVSPEATASAEQVYK